MASWYENFDSSRDMFEDTSDEDHDPTFADSDSEDNASSGSDSDEANDTQNNCPQKQDESHTNCKFKCAISFSHLQQNVLKDEYHKLGYNDQQKWLGKFCRRRTLFRRTMKSPKKKRRPNIDYFLPKGEETIKVCKSFFSATLGFNSTYYYNIKRALDVTCPGGITPPSKKGKYTRPNLLRNKIKEHVFSYHPQISHYRREHAPNRLYLSNELTVKIMHTNFCETQNEGEKVSYSLYQKIVKELNISFAKLGNEDCENCTSYKLHSKNCTESNECDICGKNLEHIKRTVDARQAYEMDKASDKLAFTADLQKILLLPRLPTHKVAIFCPRLIVMNETFASVGGKKDNINVVWNESTAGRSAKEVSCAFMKFLKIIDSEEHLSLWLDNCSAQNKNWTIFSLMVHSVNTLKFKTITLKFFEKGHSFMASDSVHASIEKKLKKTGNVYDFEHLLECIRTSGSKNKAISMAVSDFCHVRNFQAIGKLNRKKHDRPILKDLVVARFVKGSNILHYKLTHMAESYEQIDFVKSNVDIQSPFISKETPRGVNAQKKKNCDLLHIIPVEHHQFWCDLPASEKSCDLLNNRQDQDSQYE